MATRNLTRIERSKIMGRSGKYLQYNITLNRDDFTLWVPSRTGGSDRVLIDRKIVSDCVK
jgi:hypothetical protein